MGNVGSTIVEVGQVAVKTVVESVTSALNYTYSLLQEFKLLPSAHNTTVEQIMKANEEKKKEEEAAEEARLEQQKVEDHINTLEREKNEAVLNAQLAEEQAKKIASDLKLGIKPVVMPTEQEVLNAYKAVEYDSSKLHFAVCGMSGCGKSSLINALRGLDDGEEGSAKVGVVECTSKIARYVDERPDFERFVWYDIPGAGTQKVKDWRYFIDQHLFVFDFIIVPYDTRLTENDIGILMNCHRFAVPVFVVRSKADQHIDNILKSKRIKPSSPNHSVERENAKNQYIAETMADFQSNMSLAADREDVRKDPDMQKFFQELRTYIISAHTLMDVISKTFDLNDIGDLIHEVEFSQHMLQVAKERRYDPGLLQSTKEIARKKFKDIRNWVGSSGSKEGGHTSATSGESEKKPGPL